ncbi:hypothetical protein [Streptomyces sp. NBC_00887]|uniref:hypothetical protein n=1 Tax=Streptomyces sp. NBC_00887 TaxID=2975859 RepID=UPI003869C4DB|nr:hypothetical protein OG844_07225 [Streptomyces sp. NBC_00887]WSY35166.1 hypothetical protein OG844_38375 [Streptomyces sp. NBC_00887]
MTPHITEFLSRARLVTTPYTQEDIDAAEARLIARIHTSTPPAAAPPAPPAAVPEEPTEQQAAQNLNTLCEAVVTRKTALSTLNTFLTPQLPEPPGARVLGCILQLAESEENARFWWQYAAGAGDPAASYCLYLHHLALGEHGEADWWHEQTEQIQSALPSSDDSTDAEPRIKNDVSDAVTDALHAVTTTDASLLPTALRILGALKTESEPAPVPEVVGAVLDYVPAAVGPIGDFELPLPAPGFTDHIRTLTKTTGPPAPSRPRVRNRLQTRPKAAGSLIASARRHSTWCWG